MTYHIVLTTTATEPEAEELARRLVSERLSRCVQIHRGIRSIYHWEDKICDNTECLLSIKVPENGLDKVMECLPNWHPYDVPEIIAIPLSRGYEPYLQWLADWKYNQSS